MHKKVNEDFFLKLLKDLNYQFKNIDLLKQALLHSEKIKSNDTNERLEFLGDRVLGLVIAQEIYKKYPNENEGELSKRFSELVSKNSLVKIGKKINLEKYIITRSILNNKKSITESIIADSLEAIFAAIFHDSNYKKIKKVILTLWDSEIEKQKCPPINPKSRIQEWCLRNKESFPVYKVLKKKGPDHSPIFTVSLNIKNSFSTNASGKSIQEAEFAAAKKAIKYLINEK